MNMEKQTTKISEQFIHLFQNFIVTKEGNQKGDGKSLFWI